MSSSFTAEPVNGASGTLPRDSGNSIIELRLELRGTVAKRTPSNGCYFRGTRGEAQMKEKRARKGLRKALVAGGIVLAVLLVLMAIGLGCGGGQKPRKSDQGLKEVSKGEVDLMRVESGGEAPEQQGTPVAGTRTPVSPVSYTHLRAHETRHDIVCRLLL